MVSVFVTSEGDKLLVESGELGRPSEGVSVRLELARRLRRVSSLLVLPGPNIQTPASEEFVVSCI